MVLLLLGSEKLNDGQVLEKVGPTCLHAQLYVSLEL
jgi:hypothetical protein